MPRALAAGLLVLALGRVAAAASGTAPIVNGTFTGDFPPVGVLLDSTDPDAATLVCTGVLIGCRTFLTAGHCVCGTTSAQCQVPGPSFGLVYFDQAGFVPIESIAVSPDYDFPVGDVAVVTLATPVTEIAPARIDDVAAPPFGSIGTVVGFGTSGGTTDDSGLKRVGTVTTAPCFTAISDQTSVCWDFAGEGSNTCLGDSGGPLLVDLGTGPLVAGVTSGGFAQTCLATDHSYDANVFFYRDFVTAQAGADLGTTCGTLPTVGSAGALVSAFAGTLGATEPFEVHSVGVAVGTSELRVAMHGSEVAGNDFDLYVRAGATATTTAFDCRATGSNQWGFCRITNPAPGSWFLRAERVAGDGAYQIVATTFGGDGAACGNGVREPGEDCDGADLGTCATGCTPACGCTACSSSDLDVHDIVLAPRFVVKADLGDTAGTYTALDPPTAGVTIVLDDGRGVPVAIALPSGDPGWVVRNAGRGRYRWHGFVNGVRRVSFRTRGRRPNDWVIRVNGRKVGGAAALSYDTLSVRIFVGDRCATRRFHPELAKGQILRSRPAQ